MSVTGRDVGENGQVIDRDWEMARQLHQEINGQEAEQALEMQREHDAGAAGEAFRLVPPTCVPPPDENPAPPRPLWQIPNQRLLSRDEIILRPGSIWDFVDINKVFKHPKPFCKTKLMFAARNTPHEIVTQRPLQDLPLRLPRPNDDIVNLPTGRSSPEEYQFVEFKRFLNLQGQAGVWKVIETDPDLRVLFDTIRSIFFREVPRVKQYTIEWHDISAQTNFIINIESRRVQLRSQCRHCSRLNLVSTIFHILIHCSVFETSVARNREISDHDVNFRQIKDFFNRQLGLEIGTAHQFIRAPASDQDLFLCNHLCGILSEPFRGIVQTPRNVENPLEAVEHVHRERCLGNFHKVFKISRNLNNIEETLHIVHTRIPFPRIAVETPRPVNAGLNMAPREVVDIAEDGEGTSVVNLVPQIDLQDAEFDPSRHKPRKVVGVLTNQQPRVFNECAFCKRAIGVGMFGQHLDLCLGRPNS